MSKNINIIALVGETNSGKDTLAAILNFVEQGWKEAPNEDHLKAWVNNSKIGVLGNVTDFAKPLYKIASILLNVDYNVLRDRKTKEQYRPYIYKLSDTLKSSMGIDVLTNVTLNEIKDRKFTIISDLRLKFEDDCLSELNTLKIRVIRNNCAKINDHKTETEMDNIQCDLTFHNDGTIETAWKFAKEVIKLIKERNNE